MSAAPGNAIYVMDVEPLAAAARDGAEAVAKLIDLVGDDQALAQAEFEEIAEKLATTLTDVIQWMPARDQDTNQLLGALLKWLP